MRLLYDKKNIALKNFSLVFMPCKVFFKMRFGPNFVNSGSSGNENTLCCFVINLFLSLENGQITNYELHWFSHATYWPQSLKTIVP